MTPSVWFTGVLQMVPDPLTAVAFLAALVLAAVDYAVLWWADRR